MNEKPLLSIGRLVELVNQLLRGGGDLSISGVEPNFEPVPVTDFDLMLIPGDAGGLDAAIPKWCSMEERAAIYRSIFFMREGHVDLDWQSVLPSDVTYSIEWFSN